MNSARSHDVTYKSPLILYTLPPPPRFFSLLKDRTRAEQIEYRQVVEAFSAFLYTHLYILGKN